MSQVTTDAAALESQVRTARLTGVFYLALGVTGLLGFLIIRPMLFVPLDASATLARLVNHPGLARVGVALELGIVISQTLAALWFFRLFRRVDDFAAGALAACGLVNAVVVLGSAALLGTALQVALAPGEATPAVPHLMYVASTNLWQVGNVFFGLWLIPMGWCVVHARRMPRLLGRILMIGGVGYVLNGFAAYLLPPAELISGLLVLPATVGEFWMIGYLLVGRVDCGEPATTNHRGTGSLNAPA